MILTMTREMLPVLVTMARDFHEAARAPGVFSPQAWLEAWGRLLDSGDGFILGIPTELGDVVGAIGGIMFNDPNDGAVVAQEAFWYVDPECRGIGLGLLDEFTDVARLKGAERLLLSYMHALKPRALSRLYERRGFRPLETTYVKEIA